MDLDLCQGPPFDIEFKGKFWAKMVKSSNCRGRKSSRAIWQSADFAKKNAIPVKNKKNHRNRTFPMLFDLSDKTRTFELYHPKTDFYVFLVLNSAFLVLFCQPKRTFSCSRVLLFPCSPLLEVVKHVVKKQALRIRLL